MPAIDVKIYQEENFNTDVNLLAFLKLWIANQLKYC